MQIKRRPPFPPPYSLLSVFFFAPPTFLPAPFSASPSMLTLTVRFFPPEDVTSPVPVPGDAEDVFEKVEGRRGRAGEVTAGASEGGLVGTAEVEGAGANSMGAPARGVAWIDVHSRARDA